MSAQVVTSLMILAFIACGVLYDIQLSPQGRLLHSQAYRYAYSSSWLVTRLMVDPCYIYSQQSDGVAFRTGFQWVSPTQLFTWLDTMLLLETCQRVLSAGSWAYAITGPFTGQITDRIGGKKGMIVACVGAAICNLLLGLLFLCRPPLVAQQILFVILYATNVLVQGFGTSAVVKINAAWYAPSERGLFAGVFNIMLTSGYFLALGAGSSIIGSLGWAYVFVIPGAVLFEMALIIARYVKNAPSDTHKFTDKQLILVSPLQKAAETKSSSCDSQVEDEEEKIQLTPKQQMKQLMRNYTFLGYLVAVFFLCWARDGFLNWFLSFFDAVREQPLSSSDTAVIGGAWTMGGFVGGILCGWLSDVIFHSDRVMPIFIFSLLQAFMLGVIYFVSATCSVSMLGFLIFLSSVFLLGNYTLLSYTVPSDLPRDIAAGASGIMTAVGYFSTGLSGAMMGGLIDSAGYFVWALSLMTASVLAGVFTKLGSYFSARKPKHRAVIAPLPPKAEERVPLAPCSSS
ncbi:unnamed protein product [Phytophthora lilii]|uniref:Unnamed protein product n=1 Tax=Phytophthora lilii TaxID=2077276 RepID=A0A9W6WLT5_9STRA|nr:unnamed protein product [Phytophthora lilii]